jgi:spermidine/putrescine ABC transporter ATP-binding subunit
MTEGARGRLLVEGVSKTYDGVAAVRAVGFEAAPGEFIALLGPSGCGKTTLLRCIAGLVPIDEGRITVDGRDLDGVPAWRRDLGVVFQSYALFPHMSVADNVAFGLRMRRLPRAEIEARTLRALDLVRMGDYAARRPAQLSGGQQQRIALARALVTEPTVLLLDEPLGALDAKLREAMQLELRHLQRRIGITTILVTHDQGEAMTMADRIAVMNSGRIEQLGGPDEIYGRPATPFVAEFIGEMNRLDGEIVVEGAATVFRPADAAVRLRIPQGAVPGKALLMIRPEAFDLVGASAAEEGRNLLSGTVDEIILAGSQIMVFVAVEGLRLRCLLPNRPGAPPPSAGSRVGLAWDVEQAHVFPADS